MLVAYGDGSYLQQPGGTTGAPSLLSQELLQPAGCIPCYGFGDLLLWLVFPQGFLGCCRLFLLLLLNPEYSFHPGEGDQPWDFFGRNDAKAATPVLWPPHAKS